MLFSNFEYFILHYVFAFCMVAGKVAFSQTTLFSMNAHAVYIQTSFRWIGERRLSDLRAVSKWWAMMHVMQPVVLDGGWPSTHSSPTNSLLTSPPLTADVSVTLGGRAAVTASLSSSVVSGANVVDGQPQHINTAHFKTLNQSDMCSNVHIQPVTESSTDTNSIAVTNQPDTKPSANPPKPPKKPLTSYMRFSQAVSCDAFLLFSICTACSCYYTQLLSL